MLSGVSDTSEIGYTIRELFTILTMDLTDIRNPMVWVGILLGLSVAVTSIHRNADHFTPSTTTSIQS